MTFLPVLSIQKLYFLHSYMHNFYINKAIYVSLIILLCNHMNCQCLLTDLAIPQRKQASDSIILGTVCCSSTFIQTDGNIYTSYKIVADHDTIIVCKKGGTEGNLTQVIHPDVMVSSGDKGIFFLNRTTSETFVFSVGPWSFIRYDDRENMFLDCKYTFSPEQIRQNLPELAGTFDSFIQNDVQKSVMATPFITKISPDTIAAGTESILTIEGGNFGQNASGLASIELRNPDVGVLITAYRPVPLNHILSWTDKKIRCIVPGRDPKMGLPGAGSGNFRLKNNLGELTYSPPLFVKYNRFVSGATHQFMLQNDNEDGGYTMTMNTSFQNNLPAASAFENALKTWQCAVKSNFTLAQQSSSIKCAENDGVNLIAFDDACALPAGVLGQTTHWFITCADGQVFILEMDMIFDKGSNWSYNGTTIDALKFDFESTVLHELGHVHGLGHSLVDQSTMFPNIFPGKLSRNLDRYTIEGGNNISQESEQSINVCNISPYKRLNTCGDTCTIALNSIPVSSCLDNNILYLLSIEHSQKGQEIDVYVDGNKIDTRVMEASFITMTITLSGDGKNHTIRVQDVRTASCFKELEILSPLCQCKLSLTLNQNTPCKSDSVSYQATVVQTNVRSPGFYLFKDGSLVRNQIYSYNQTGISNFEWTFAADGKAHLIKIVDSQDVLCSDEISVVLPNCVCTISATVLFDRCVDTMSRYKVLVKNTHANDSLQLFFNDVLLKNGTVAYDIDGTTFLEIDLPSNTSGLLKIQDKKNVSCSDDKIMVTPSCFCTLSSQLIDVKPCITDSFDVTISLEFGLNHAPIFDILVNNNIYTSLSYNTLGSGSMTITLRLSAAKSEALNLTISDAIYNTCTTELTFTAPKCACQLTLTATPKNDCISDNLTTVKFVLYHKNNGIQGFDVLVNQNLVTNFSYAGLDSTSFDILLPANGQTYSIEVADDIVNNCSSEIQVVSFDCGCGLVSEIVEKQKCAAGKQTFLIQCTNNIKETEVDVFLDGIRLNESPLSTTEMQSLPFSIEVLADGSDKKMEWVEVSNPNCKSVLWLQTDECNCSLEPKLIQKKTCDVSGQNIWIYELKSVHEPFSIWLDGIQIDDVTVTMEKVIFEIVLDGDGNEHQVEILYLDGFCRNIFTVESNLCTCFTDVQLSFPKICENNGNLELNMEFLPAPYATDIDIFIDGIKINATSLNFSTVNSTNYTVKLFGDGEIHRIEIVDVYGRCSIEKTINFPLCPCSISTSLQKIKDCGSSNLESYQLSIHTLYLETSQWTILLDGQLLDIIEHVSPTTTFNIDIFGDGKKHVISIFNPSFVCSSELDFLVGDCTCKLQLNGIVSKPCIEDSLTEISCSLFTSFPVGKQAFIFVDETYAGSIKYATLGLNPFVIRIPGDGQIHHIKVEDEMDTFCFSELQITSSLCTTPDTCKLSFEQLNYSICTEDSTTVQCKFSSYQNKKGSYQVFINDKLWVNSPIEYDASGINTFSFQTGCDTFRIEIQDTNGSFCKIDTTIIPITKEKRFSYYPNPFKNSETLILKNIDKKYLDKLLPFTLYDQLGRKMTNILVLGKNTLGIDLSELNLISGMYYFTLGKENSYVGKLIVVEEAE